MRLPWKLVKTQDWQDAQDALAELRAHVRWLQERLLDERLAARRQAQVIADLKNALQEKVKLDGPSNAPD